MAAEGVLGVRWQWRQWGGDTTPVGAAKKETHQKNTSVHCVPAVAGLSSSLQGGFGVIFVDLLALIQG